MSENDWADEVAREIVGSVPAGEHALITLALKDVGEQFAAALRAERERCAGIVEFCDASAWGQGIEDAGLLQEAERRIRSGENP